MGGRGVRRQAGDAAADALSDRRKRRHRLRQACIITARVRSARTTLSMEDDLTTEMRWAAIIAAFVLALGVVAHALLPRYSYQVSSDAAAVMIYDRWSGKFQRAVYGSDGQLQLQAVIAPF